jgi:CubicO group peptidase (beta-lactamase class C family)
MLFGAGKDDVAHYTASLPLAHAPNTHYNYSSGTTNIISRIIADHFGYGEAYRAELDRRLFTPLGMASATATFDPAGVFIGSSYVHATAREYAKFGYLYLRGGQWEGRQLVSPNWIHTAQVAQSFDDELQLGYSWQWWVYDDEFGTFAAQGFEGQRIVVIPALDAVIVRCGKTPTEQNDLLQAWLRRVIEALV